MSNEVTREQVHALNVDTEMAQAMIADDHAEALRENWARDQVAAAGKSWETHMVKFDGTVLPR